MDHADRTVPSAGAINEGEMPRPSGNAGLFGSDVVADALREMDVPYMALVPGSSMRGVHDSVINRLGNTDPRLIICLHEEASVAIAHGYAKITGKAMAAALHANVGLMHAVMSIYNAFCDRMPILLLGASGPADAEDRRPWIDWIHTTADQAHLIRGSVKWDDTPGSPEAARQAVVRAKWIAETVPQGPTYINLDVGLQEQKLAAPLPERPAKRWSPGVRQGADAADIAEIADLLKAAKRPVLLMGRCSRSEEGWDQRVALAEHLGAHVATNLKSGAAFPTEHPLHLAYPGTRLVKEANAVLREADLIVSFDWIDLAGALKVAFEGELPGATVVQISRDHAVHTGIHKDHQAQPFVDLFVSADPDAVVPALNQALGAEPGRSGKDFKAEAWPLPAPETRFSDGMRTIYGLAAGVREAVGDRAVTLTNLPLSWNGGFWPFRHPLDYAGGDGASGIGGGPGIAVGEALALKGMGRIPICICGDGDFMMGHTALWTAVHYRLPLLVVIANNACYFNDVKHQEEMATTRGREVANKWIGQNIEDPEVDLAGFAKAQGATGYGPVQADDDLTEIIAQAIADVEAGGVAVVDVRIKPGYAR